MFLWCGSSEGLDLGRLCLQHWGFRRCEDICWIQTNHKTGVDFSPISPKLVRTYPHIVEKPVNYNGTIIFGIDIMKKSSPIN